MLKQEVIESVKSGQLHVWPVSTVKEGVEILTGMEAGTLQPDGTYPESTLIRRVDERFLEIAEIVKKFVKEEEKEGRKPSEEE